MKKSAQAASIIGGADGPTSVFIVKENARLTLRQKLERFKNKRKRVSVERKIHSGSHSLDEVMEYLVTRYGFAEIEKDSAEAAEEYRQMRASFLIQYAPELLGEYAVLPELKSELREDILSYLNQVEQQTQRAMEVPKEQFDIDFHMFRKIMNDADSMIDITIEKNYAYIGGAASGSKSMIRKFRKIEKDVYRYYGVTEEDIQKKSRRYQELVQMLIQ